MCLTGLRNVLDMSKIIRNIKKSGRKEMSAITHVKQMLLLLRLINMTDSLLQ